MNITINGTHTIAWTLASKPTKSVVQRALRHHFSAVYMANPSLRYGDIGLVETIEPQIGFVAIEPTPEPTPAPTPAPTSLIRRVWNRIVGR